MRREALYCEHLLVVGMPYCLSSVLPQLKIMLAAMSRRVEGATLVGCLYSVLLLSRNTEYLALWCYYC